MKKLAFIILFVAVCGVGCGSDQNGLDVFALGNQGSNNNPSPNPNPGNVSPVGQATFAFMARFPYDPATHPLDQDFTFRARGTQQLLVDLQNLPSPSFTQADNFPFTLGQRLAIPDFFVFQLNPPNRHLPIYHMDAQILDPQSVDFESIDFISGPSLNPDCQVSISFINGTIRPTSSGNGYELLADEVMTVTHASDAQLCFGWL